MMEEQRAEAKQAAKYTRNYRKSVVTRASRDIERFIVEDKPALVRAKLTFARRAYDDFIVADTAYVELCAECEAEVNELYYEIAHNIYITALCMAKRFLGELPAATVEISGPTDPPTVEYACASADSLNARDPPAQNVTGNDSIPVVMISCAHQCEGQASLQCEAVAFVEVITVEQCQSENAMGQRSPTKITSTYNIKSRRSSIRRRCASDKQHRQSTTKTAPKKTHLGKMWVSSTTRKRA